MAEEDVTFRPRISEYAKTLKSHVLADYRGERKVEKLDYYAQLRCAVVPRLQLGAPELCLLAGAGAPGCCPKTTTRGTSFASVWLLAGASWCP